VNTTGWLKGLRVTTCGAGIVSHAGVALVRALADNIGLTAGLSRTLASRRLLVHDRGRVMADLACAIANGTEAVSDFRVIGDQGELFGLVASVPTAWRMLSEAARGGERALGRISAAVNAARRRASDCTIAGAAARIDGSSQPSSVTRTGARRRGPQSANQLRAVSSGQAILIPDGEAISPSAGASRSGSRTWTASSRSVPSRATGQGHRGGRGDHRRIDRLDVGRTVRD
jgi:hypothetical protein